VYAERAVDARAGEAEEDAEFGRGLWVAVLVFVKCTYVVTFASNILVALHVAIQPPSTYPLWTGSTAINAAVVLICLCDLTQFGAGLRVDLPHFTHFDQVTFALSVLGIWRRGVFYWRESGRDGGEKRKLDWRSGMLWCGGSTAEGGFS
jgi:hypothetical protein